MDVWSFKDQDAFWKDTFELSGTDIKTRFKIKLLRLALKAYCHMINSKPKLVIIKKAWKWRFNAFDEEASPIIVSKQKVEDVLRLRRSIPIIDRERLSFSLRGSYRNKCLQENANITGPATPNIRWNKLFLKRTQNYVSRNKNTLVCSTVNPMNSSLSSNLKMKLSLHSRKASLSGTTQEPTQELSTYNSQLLSSMPMIRRNQKSKILVLKKSRLERYAYLYFPFT